MGPNTGEMARRSSVEEFMFRNVWNRVLIKEEVVPRGIAVSFDGFEKKVNVYDNAVRSTHSATTKPLERRLTRC